MGRNDVPCSLAYGGLFALCDEGRALLRGIDQADSIALDPHKTLFLPYGTGAALVRDGQHLLDTFSADIAVWLNITPDHIDRHGDMAGYVAAKANIFARQRPGDCAVIGIDDAPSRAVFDKVSAPMHRTRLYFPVWMNCAPIDRL